MKAKRGLSPEAKNVWVKALKWSAGELERELKHLKKFAKKDFDPECTHFVHVEDDKYAKIRIKRNKALGRLKVVNETLKKEGQTISLLRFYEYDTRYASIRFD